ncbi:MAG: Ltp family lipoprotein [Mycobacterium sp.]|uniref:Ltp family lipoprotein n=1 Tax=Mycobacterium sp. TaxID=1785 RepID=UPI003F9576CE
MTAPGWFPDPSDPSRQRYFDGRAWTENYAPFGPPAQAVGQPSKTGMSSGLKIGLGVGAVILALIVLGSIGNSGKNSSTSSNTGSMASTAGVAPTTTKSGFTPAQDNAIAKAESYLNTSAFSKKGLIEQLVYNKFSQADATFAVEHIEASGGVDWNEQAVKKARSYLSTSSFSLQGLIEQLEYNGFTPSQAQYGANAAYGG